MLSYNKLQNSAETTYGYVACAFAVLLYGSYFVPIKRIETGDGKDINCTLLSFKPSRLSQSLLYFQECFSSGFAVRVYGLLDWLLTRCFTHPELIPLLCLEEHFGPQVKCFIMRLRYTAVIYERFFFFFSGHVSAVPVVKFIGLGLGILLWGSSALLMGWASSR